MMKRVLLLAVGGTIACHQTEDGLAPSIQAKGLLSFVPGIADKFIIESIDVFSMDSSNMQPEDWQVIARQISANVEQYDGIIVLHGTDTMAYTASALSFMLQNLKIPVILTGSQVPIDYICTDAVRNLQLAFAAVDMKIPGVSIAFDNIIIRGSRASKVRTMGFKAFESIGLLPLAENKADGLHMAWTPTPATGPFILNDTLCSNIFVLKIFPGLRPDVIDLICDAGYRGIVLEAYGAGGAPFIKRDLVEKIKQAVERGLVVVACSQCLYEPSDLTMYEVGTRLLDSGVIPANDMTKEAIITKLMWALGQSSDLTRLKELFTTNYCDEISLQNIAQSCNKH